MSESMNREGLSIAIVRDSEFSVPRIRAIRRALYQFLDCASRVSWRRVRLAGIRKGGLRLQNAIMHIKYRAAAGDLVRRSRVVNDSYSGHLTHRRSAQQPMPCFVVNAYSMSRVR